jgi:outer membrane protein TolC
VAAVALMIGAAVGVGLLSGCSAAHHRKSADKEVYGIVEQAERAIFGVTNYPFTIDTSYSARKPEEVLAKEIIENRQAPGTLSLTIEDALELAVKNSREYQTEKERLYLTALSLTGARYEFSPQFFAGGSTSFNRDENGEYYSSGSSRVGVSQLLKSGGSLGVTLANDFLRYYSGDPNRSAISAISVNLMQPLLRGAGSSIAAESLKQAERNVVYAIRTYSQYQRQFKVDIVNSYFQLLQNKDQLVNAYNDYQRRLETIQYTEARGEAGKQTQLDVDEARTEELSAKNSYILAATTYLNNLDRFKITMGLPLTTRVQLDDSPLRALKDAGLTPLAVDRDLALKTAIENHLELLNQIDQFEDSKRKVKVAANRLKADLNIFADARLDSERPTDYTHFNLDEIKTGFGIELDLPIDRLRERNEYRTTLVNFESAIRTLSRNLDNKKDAIDRGIRNLEASRRTYSIQTNSVVIAERRVEGEQLSLQAGRRTVRNVRDAQDVLIRSQNALTAAIVSYLDVRMQLLLDIGALNTDVAKFWEKTDAVAIPLKSDQPAIEQVPPKEEVVPPEVILQL